MKKLTNDSSHGDVIDAVRELQELNTRRSVFYDRSTSEGEKLYTLAELREKRIDYLTNNTFRTKLVTESEIGRFLRYLEKDN